MDVYIYTYIYMYVCSVCSVELNEGPKETSTATLPILYLPYPIQFDSILIF